MSTFVNYEHSTLVGNAVLALFYNGLRRIPGNRARVLEPRGNYPQQLVRGDYIGTHMVAMLWPYCGHIVPM